ncbi:MAG: hypothetical protein MUO23_11915 [Anaerolineales bacterium]|nr:hypothetical protein [Anaerolineales bacterium]
MRVDALLSDLAYKGEASGLRQTYHVFQGKHHYLVLSFSHTKPNAGYFNIVDPDAVDYVRSKFAGEKGVTSKAIHQRAGKAEHIKGPLQALNILYVLTATHQAQVDNRFHDRELHFNLKA